MRAWPEKPLVEVARLTRGTEPGSASYTDASRGVRFLRVGDITGKSNNPVHTNAANLVLVTETDVLLALDGSPGYVSTGHRGAISSGIRKVVPKEPKEVSSDWLRYGLMSQNVQHTINRHTTGMTILHASSSIPHIRVAIPPPYEQLRIVKILDEVEQLRRIRAEADKRTANLIPALFHEMFEDVAANPVQLLSNVSEIVSGIAKGRQLNGKTTVTVPYLRVANVQAGYLDLSEIKTIEALPSEVDYLSLRRGDVLLTEGGDFDKLGRGALWEYDLENCIHQNHIFRVRPTKGVLDSVFFTAYLQSPKAREYFLRCAKRTTNLASINMTQLRNLPVPIPSMGQQSTFTACVAEIRAMITERAASRQRLDDLFQSLLYRAFQGGL